ncbi:MAG: glycerophosphodiester phosphodiesterase family protein [Thiohalocapsa sp.]
MIVPHITAPYIPAPFAGPLLPAVIGHRGAAAWAPENTLAGLRKAAELGCRWVEFDVRLSADGVAVLCHDPRLDRTTDGVGRISELSLAAVRRCDAGRRFGPHFAGERVPRLEEALGLCAELGLGANIEIKAERGRDYATAAAVAAQVAAVVARLDRAAPPLLVSSFQPAAVEAARRLMPSVPRAILFRLVPRHWAEIARRFACLAVGVDHRRLRRSLAGRIRAAGYPLMAYTVNHPARARLLFEWGVTSVFSDVPDIILAAVGHRVARLTAGLPQRPAAQQGAVG